MKASALLPILLLASSWSSADVQSLTSHELTETYIEDSTIIVTPAKTEAPKPNKRVVSYTIDPAAPVKEPAEELAEVMQDKDHRRARARDAEEEVRYQFLQTTLVNDQRQPIDMPEVSNREMNVHNVPPIELPRPSTP